MNNNDDPFGLKTINSSEEIKPDIIEENVVQEENLDNHPEVVIENNNKNKKQIIILSVIIFVTLVMGTLLLINKDKVLKYISSFNDNHPEVEKPNNSEVIETPIEIKKNDYVITTNSLDNFDLAFLKIENKNKNIIYSPLSIKYALGMLMQGADKETKTQINDILGNYKFHKFTSNKNMSFANALFIKNSYKDSIKKSYIEALTKNFGADVKYDSFENANIINKYASDKTFGLINNLVDDIKEEDFILLNALAIDMNWVHRIQLDEGYEEDNDLFKDDEGLFIYFNHMDYYKTVERLNEADYHKLSFNSDGIGRQSVEIGAVINNYDIVKILGKDKIKKTVMDDYNDWVSKGAQNACEECDGDLDFEDPNYEEDYENSCKKDTSFDFENYLKELDSNYGYVKGSTDFEFYLDDKFKVFKKDLRKYGDTTLQYVGIMPIKEKLQSFINKTTASDLTKLINSTKKIESKNFKDGVITDIKGYIPLFNFDYELNLIEDLNKLGVIDVFDEEKADLSNLTSKNAYINSALHKATIEFTNDGIKAAAVTEIGGRGAGDCGYDYLFTPPVEYIDLTFDKPFLFFIIDKSTKEVWFVGSVYEPDKYKSYLDIYEELHPYDEDDEEE